MASRSPRMRVTGNPPADARRKPAPAIRTLLVGTPASVTQLDHALALLEPRPDVIGCVLTDPTRASDVGSVAVLGDIASITQTVRERRVEQVLLAIPLAMADTARRLARELDHHGVTWRFMPTIADQLAGRSAPILRAATGVPGGASAAEAGSLLASPFIDPVALLDRRPQPLDTRAIQRSLGGKVVMITGAGGSIGSELARNVCRFSPDRIVLLERSENALFEIDREIAASFPELKRSAVLHDVANAAKTLGVVTMYKPHVIFHAAAHKHVPMMEEHPSDAVENNFYGTRSIADAAARCAAERFVMISSDKAVNPSSVMGATKRMAELYVQYLNQRSDTTFCMVRFGNVLGSACSVLPIWAKQIAQGRAVTVTHPDMLRYFMTIPEAAGLVLQSAAFAGGEHAQSDTAGTIIGGAAAGMAGSPGLPGAEVFLLDMGKPIRVLDMARRFIRLQGLEPDVDVKIEFTGIRPGEKLFEELAYDGEDMLPTPHASVRVWRTTPPEPARIQQIVATFDRLRNGTDGAAASHPWQQAGRDAILAAIRAAVPEMITPRILAAAG